MLAVAIVVLARSVEVEAPLLAADLGALGSPTTAYEAGIALRAGSPTIVFRTTDRARALDLSNRLRGRGHEVVASDQAAMIPSHAMISMRRFRFEGSSIVATDHDDTHLPFDDVLVLLRASHRTRVESRDQVTETRLRPAAAIATGGIVSTKTTTREIVTTTDEKEPVLYVFRRSGERPWILHATHTHYTALGPELRPTQIENFQTTVRILRERATSATFDERLLHVRAPATPLHDHRDGTAGAEGIDALANLLALWYVRRGPSAYRG